MDKNIAKICQIVCTNWRVSMSSIVDQVNIDRETVQKVSIEDLGMCNVCVKMVPKELTDKQKQRRVELCTDLSLIHI